MAFIFIFLLLVITGLILISVKESLDNEYKKDKLLIPFFKAIIKVQRISFIKKYIYRWILHIKKPCDVLYGQKESFKTAVYKCTKIMAEGLLIVTVACFLGLIIIVSSSEKDIKSLSRPEPGEGEVVYELQAEIDGENRKIPISISEKEYSDEEVEELFEYGCLHIGEWILAENTSLDNVSSNLDLISKIPDSDISIYWESDNYSIIEADGSLIYENLVEEGTSVTLTATFTYGDVIREKDIVVIIKKKTKEGINGKFAMLEEYLREEEKTDKTSDTYMLPEQISGDRVKFTEEETHSEVIILILAVVVVILLPFEEKNIMDKKIENRNRQMLIDYPELVYKLSLYMGAGMTISSSWERVALSYVKQRNDNLPKRYCNEEVLYTYRQLQTGKLKSKAFEEFGNRCGLQLYKKLSLLINSNIKKGSSDLSDILVVESKEAFENRKSDVIKLANEAAARLMLPMLLELLIVIGVLIIPAFMSMKF